MGDYLRLLTLTDRDIPLADLQRAARTAAVWSVDHPGTLGNYLAIGLQGQTTLDPNASGLTALAASTVWATIERNPIGPNTLGAEEVAEFIDSLEAGGPPPAVRWLSDYLESVRAIYAIRLYPEAMAVKADAFEAIYSIRTALREAVGGIGQWDGYGFTNEDDQLIWCSFDSHPSGKVGAAVLDEATGGWIPFELNCDDPDEVAAFLRGELLRPAGA